jgi:hypothetical protein
VDLCFFFRVDEGIAELVTTEELQQNLLTGPSNGTPNICSLYQRLTKSSTATHKEVNSGPNMEVSTVF